MPTSLHNTNLQPQWTSGWRANCALNFVFANAFAGLFFSAILPSFFGTPLASLTTAQWFTARL